MVAAAIEVEDVWKQFRLYQHRATSLKETLLAHRSKYETFWALQKVNFEVPKGESFGIVGLNGSGKSTLLKILARIYAPDRGVVRIRGKVAALLELGTGFHPELTGRDNLYLAGSILRLSKQEINERFDDIVAFSQLESFIDVPVKNYSSGMYARLAFALSINVDAELLLVDEVLSVGDALFQQRCHDRMRQLQADGTTIVFVSHSFAAVRDLCSTALWLNSGQMQSLGPTDVVLGDYGTSVMKSEALLSTNAAGAERAGSGDVRVESVRLDGLTPSGRIETDGPIEISVEYASKRLRDDIRVSAQIRDVSGNLVATAPHRGGPSLAVRHGAGVLTFESPSLPLPPGLYTVDMILHEQSGGLLDMFKGARQIQVFASPEAGPGGRRLAGEWKESGERTLPSTAVSD